MPMPTVQGAKGLQALQHVPDETFVRFAIKFAALLPKGACVAAELQMFLFYYYISSE
jgi:hypothetical protein